MQLSTSNPLRRLPYKWIVVLVVTFGAFMSTLDVTVINNALPSLQHAFATDLHNLQWIVTAYTLPQGVVTPTTAFVASRLTTKRSYLIALRLFPLGSAPRRLPSTPPPLIPFRAFHPSVSPPTLPLPIP